MTEEEKTTTPKKRRTKAEMKAYHEGELKRLAAEEKAEVVRLLSDVHDTLMQVHATPAAAPIGATVFKMAGDIKTLIAAAQK